MSNSFQVKNFTFALNTHGYKSPTIQVHSLKPSGVSEKEIRAIKKERAQWGNVTDASIFLRRLEELFQKVTGNGIQHFISIDCT